MSIGIAYNPCKNCKEMDRCSICELTYYRKGYIKSPTADGVEVVRCKDCQWWEWEYAGGTVGRCQNPRNGLIYELTDDTDYCSYGERREENEG